MLLQLAFYRYSVDKSHMIKGAIIRMIFSKNFTLKRRTFIKGAMGVAAITALPLTSFAARERLQAADGVLHMDNEGHIHIHSGTGHVGPYADQKALSVVSTVLNCRNEHCFVNMGHNPDHLFALLGQFSNHLSFSSAKTNEAAALKLQQVIIVETIKRFGHDEYHLKDGFIYGRGQRIEQSELVRSMNVTVIENGVSQSTVDYIEKMNKGGIIVAVQEVI